MIITRSKTGWWALVTNVIVFNEEFLRCFSRIVAVSHRLNNFLDFSYVTLQVTSLCRPFLHVYGNHFLESHQFLGDFVDFNGHLVVNFRTKTSDKLFPLAFKFIYDHLNVILDFYDPVNLIYMAIVVSVPVSLTLFLFAATRSNQFILSKNLKSSRQVISIGFTVRIKSLKFLWYLFFNVWVVFDKRSCLLNQFLILFFEVILLILQISDSFAPAAAFEEATTSFFLILQSC